jgi:hypothetical protein
MHRVRERRHDDLHHILHAQRCSPKRDGIEVNVIAHCAASRQIDPAC